GGAEPGALLTLDLIYDLTHTALSGDVQAGMTRVLERCAHDADDLKVRIAKAVALLQLIHDIETPTPELVARCLYDRLDRGDPVSGAVAMTVRSSAAVSRAPWVERSATGRTTTAMERSTSDCAGMGSAVKTASVDLARRTTRVATGGSASRGPA
ncbi:MAG: hypothetical protein KC656_37520, partial [Myxococcales bacterium]|nr:hypothetical protein [Myxococcales bacterium]